LAGRACVTAFAFGTRYPRPDWLPAAVGFRPGRLPGRVQRAACRLGVPVERACRLGSVDALLGLNLHPLRSARPVLLGVADVSWRTFAGQYRTTFDARQIRAAEAAIRAADHVLTLSHASAAALAAGGYPADRIRIAPLGAADEFHGVTPADAARVRAAHRLPDRFVLYVGGINERKNLPVLVAAMDRLGGAVPLVLAGPVPAEPLGYWGLDRPWARHLGYVPDADVPGLYAAATVKVFPSKLEGFGLPLVEAMAAGCPVLAADTPVFREVGGDAAAFFPPDDPDRLAALTRTAVASPTFRDDLAGRGRAHAARYTWANYADALLDALRRTAAGGRR
jgi:glycosyltransferase involved in cell wall biosynthesis